MKNIKQPKSLPWHLTKSSNNDTDNFVETVGGKVISCLYNEDSKEDGEYIVKACNNFPKVLKFLLLLKKDCEVAIDEYNRPDLNEFLKSLENE